MYSVERGTPLDARIARRLRTWKKKLGSLLAPTVQGGRDGVLVEIDVAVLGQFRRLASLRRFEQDAVEMR